MPNYFFSLRSYLSTHSVFFTCSMLNYFFSLSSYLATHYVFFTCSMLIYFFSLSSYLATHCFFHMLDAQLFLQSQLLSGNTLCFFFTCSMLNYFFSLRSYLANHLFFSHARCSTISSVSARNWQLTLFIFHMLDAQLTLQSQFLSRNTMCCITCWMLRCLPGLSV